MGFPAPRVARAVQRLGTNDKEVSSAFNQGGVIQIPW